MCRIFVRIFKRVVSSTKRGGGQNLLYKYSDSFHARIFFKKSFMGVQKNFIFHKVYFDLSYHNEIAFSSNARITLYFIGYI